MSRTHVRIHVEAPTDAKWLPIADACGCPAGAVWATWTALLAHARKRGGSVLEFDRAAWAQFAGYAPELVDQLVEAFERRGLIGESGRPVKWAEHNPTKTDRTAAERQQRRRDRLRIDRERAERTRRRARKGVTPVTDSGHDDVTPVTPTDVTAVTHPQAESHARDTASRRVTPRHAGGGYRGGAVGSASASFKHHASNNLPRTTRALNAGDVFERLAREGIAVGYLARKWNLPKVRDWIAAGLTSDQLGDAIDRAHAARRRDRSNQPVSIGYLAVHVADVLGGKPMRASRNPISLETCDAAAAHYVASRSNR